MFKKFFNSLSLSLKKFCRQITLEEKTGIRDQLIKEISKILPTHYVSEETLQSWLQGLGASKSLELLKQKLPEKKISSSGDLGEILATEYVNHELEYKVPVKKLRWKDSREVSLRGDDFIGFIDGEDSLKILKGEVKSRQQLNSSTMDKLEKQLDDNKGRPSRHSMLFIASRLRESELRNSSLASKIEKTLAEDSIKQENIEQLGFTFSGNCPKEIHLKSLKKYAGKIKRTLVGLHIRDHQDFISTVYQEIVKEKPVEIIGKEIRNKEKSLSLEKLIKPGFRGDLLARGMARGMIWKDGHVLGDRPKFSKELTEDLLDYGYALFSIALKKLNFETDNPLLKKAFLIAGESIESVVRKGDPLDIYRGYHTITAAIAFHLAGYSARSYCMIPKDFKNLLNISYMEHSLIYLLRRELSEFRKWIETVFNEDILLKDDNEISNSDLIQQFAIEENFLSAMAYLEFALRTGDHLLMKNAISRLDKGISVSKDFSHVPFWWGNFMTKFLVQDLWGHTLHKVIPQQSEPQWMKLRQLFISSLYMREKSEVDLWPSQIEAGKRCFNEKDDLVVTLPTSAGKTRIAELCILRTLSLQKRVIYITPLRALSAQTERILSDTFTPLGFTVSSLYGATGSTGIDVNTLKNQDIVVSTPEKLSFALRNDPQILDDVGLVIFDEGHTIGLGEREINYEILIQKILTRKDADHRRLVCLSAMFPQGQELNNFLGWIRQDNPGDPIQSNWKPTRQRFGIVEWKDGYARLDFEVESEKPFVHKFIEAKFAIPPRRKSFPKDKNELVLASAWKQVNDSHKVLIYCPQRRSVKTLAELALDLCNKDYLQSLVENTETSSRNLIDDTIQSGKEWLGEDHIAIKCLRLGIAVHHAGLPRPFLQSVERLIRENICKIIISSPTLAQGLNLSASCLIVHSIYRERKPVPKKEFLNVIGRAGRAFVDIDGIILFPVYESDTRKKNKQIQAWDELTKSSQVENIQSGLFLLIEKLITLISNSKGYNKDDVLEYLLSNQQVEIWKSPEQTYNISEDDIKKWVEYLSYLDIAILSLADDLDAQPDQITQILDDILKGSFWQRQMKLVSERDQKLHKKVLEKRTMWIWSNTTTQQRRAYFSASIGVECGKYIDDHKEMKNNLLEIEIDFGEKKKVIEKIVAIAKLAFRHNPFKPYKYCDNWQDILKEWLSGTAVSEITKIGGKETISFIQDALVYKLVWAFEAVRNLIHTSSIKNEGMQKKPQGTKSAEIFSIVNESMDPLEPQDVSRYATLAVECGSLNLSECTLIKAGLNSRVAAKEAVKRGQGEFQDYSNMRAWLRELPRDENWPTPETAKEWNYFIERNNQREEPLEIKKWISKCQWSGQLDKIPQIGSKLRIEVSEKNLLIVYSPDFKLLGNIEQNENNISDSANIWATVVAKNQLEITYIGKKLTSLKK